MGSGEEAVYEVNENRPDVILMDIMMTGMTAVNHPVDQRKRPHHQNHTGDHGDIQRYVSAEIKSGVDGYAPKDIDQENLLGAIRTVKNGGRFFNDAIMKLVFEDFYSHEN